MKNPFHLNNSDRKVLILLIILVLSFIGYTRLKQPSRNMEDGVMAQAPVKRSPSNNNSDTSQFNQPNSNPQLLADTFTNKKDSTPPIITTNRYPGPPRRPVYIPKLRAGATIDLNTADTTLLKRLPSIGSSFAKRIVKYRSLLGGYYCVEQLQEVYGMDRERYERIAPFCKIRSEVNQIYLSKDSIQWHPYLSYRQRDIIIEILNNNPPLTWQKLMHSPYFRHDDSLRLAPYTSKGIQ